MSHATLRSFYKEMFIMKIDFNWNIDEINNLIPWEKEAYLIQTAEYVRKRAEEAKR